MSITLYPNKHASLSVHEMYISNTKNVVIDFSVLASGTSLSTANWSVQEGDSVSLGTPSLASNVATCALTSSSKSGCSLIRCIATMANGEVISEYFKMNVKDPYCVGNRDEYRTTY